ncbi:hypothetical protein LOD99_13073 [Oopsacas minuta]|uniref:Ferric-chelate reductase 1 n=1 Tax=Oopsacas minuta TaxID=111878 RepID=A0AAV7JAR6_9METZ|nr:hypothetical protein LOD99_13073 [Oopsacas minuta]
MRSICLSLLFIFGIPAIYCAIDPSLFDACDVTQTCFQGIPGSCNIECTPSNCRLLFTIEDIPSENRLLIGLHSDGNYRYMALGFSRDRLMRDTDVVACEKVSANSAVAKDSFNPGGRTNVYDNDDSAISNFTYEINGNIFSCSFTRDYLPPDLSTGYALNSSSFFLFLANRDAGSFGSQTSNLLQHTFTPCISESEVNLTNLTIIVSSSTDNTLVKAHGLMMILAWSVFIGTGVFMASYTKFLFNNGEWFHFHKYINSLAVIIALIGLVLIIYSVKGWRFGSVALWAHQLIGLASILLMLINPIIAAFRCRPQAKFRWIFRIIHQAVGYTSIILASTAICLGLSLYYALINRNLSVAVGFWLYICRLVTEWLFFIPLIIYVCFKGHKLNKCKDGEGKPLPKVKPFKLFFLNIFAPPKCPTGENRKIPEREWPILLLVLIGFIVYNLAFYIAIVIAIALSEEA